MGTITSVNLIEQLLKTPETFNFFQAVRLLRHDATQDYHVHFLAPLSLVFPKHDLLFAKQVGSDVTLAVTFLQWFGLQGRLSSEQRETILNALMDDEPHVKSFMCVLHHRLLDLYYQAWSKPNIFLQAERVNLGSQAQNDWYNMVLALLGYNPCKQSSILTQIKLSYASLWLAKPRTAEHLEQLINKLFSVPVTVQSFQARRVTIPEEEKLVLSGGHSLSLNAVLGERVCLYQSSLKVIIGPLADHIYQYFLPKGQWYALLHDLLSEYLGKSYQYHVKLTHTQPTPTATLGSKKKLGQNIWLSRA